MEKFVVASRMKWNLNNKIVKPLFIIENPKIASYARNFMLDIQSEIIYAATPNSEDLFL